MASTGNKLLAFACIHFVNMAEEELTELRANLAEYKEQLVQVWIDQALIYVQNIPANSFLFDVMFGDVQLEELLLDEPDNEDYRGLYADVEEVRRHALN